MYELLIKKLYHMPNEKTDNQGFSTLNQDLERDNAAKGGPMTGPGNPDNQHAASKPYDEDQQAQIAAKSGKKRTEEAQEENKKDFNQG
jgi:hypothetical protein